MLHLGSFTGPVCQGATRRSFLTAAGTLPWMLGRTRAETVRPVKSVVLLWLWGGPSHIDTVDPKPNAPAEYRGPFATIPTRIPGVRFTELLPNLAARADRFSLIRSHKNSDADHLKAGTIGLTGFAQGADGLAPSFGSIAAKGMHAFKPGANKSGLPGFVATGRGNPRDVVGPCKGYGGGNWGTGWDPFLVGCSPEGEVDLPALTLMPGLTPEALSDRRRLVGALDGARAGFEAKGWAESATTAWNLLDNPEARRALDIGRETVKSREAYGTTAFGQSCLMARRLVESGVPFIQVNWSQYVEAMTPNTDFGWDTHIYNFELLADRLCPILDRALPALLDDLAERGLLEDTLVVAMGEFGRSPRITGQAARDHWPRCYFSLWAGGGVVPGRLIGESDSRGEDPITEPIYPVHVGTTMMERLGFDSQARAELGVLRGGRLIHELF